MPKRCRSTGWLRPSEPRSIAIPSAALIERYQAFIRAFDGARATICYSLKANSNQAVIATFARLGAGADVVSEGEMRRALAAGVPPERIVFAGVGKGAGEMIAGLEAGHPAVQRRIPAGAGAPRPSGAGPGQARPRGAPGQPRCRCPHP